MTLYKFLKNKVCKKQVIIKVGNQYYDPRDLNTLIYNVVKVENFTKWILIHVKEDKNLYNLY